METTNATNGHERKGEAMTTATTTKRIEDNDTKATGLHRCGRCAGTGRFQKGSGDCYRCGGRGRHDQADRIRNARFDRYYINQSAT